MKKSLILVSVVSLVLSGASVFAEESAVVTSMAVPTLYTTTVASVTTGDVVVPALAVPTTVASVTEREEVITAKTLPKIQARGSQLIKERVNSLNQNADAVAKSKLTADQKQAFAIYFTGKIADLNTLGTKIASSTDATSTKALISSIFTDYRIYAVAIPQIRLQKRIYEVQNHIAKLSDTFTKVQTNIDAAKAKGKDVAVWQKMLDDAKTLVATDSTKLTALMTLANNMKPADYPTTSKTTITTVNAGIKSVVNDLNSIGKKVRKPLYMKNIKATTTPVTATTTAH